MDKAKYLKTDDLYKHVLDVVLSELKSLLSDQSKWDSCKIEYESSFINKISRVYEFDGQKYTINLFEFVSSGGDVLFHPNPWPMIVKIFYGKCGLLIGVGDSLENVTIISKMLLNAGSVYSFFEENIWYSITPIEKPIEFKFLNKLEITAKTIMINGPYLDPTICLNFNEYYQPSDRIFLSDEEKSRMIKSFLSF